MSWDEVENIPKQRLASDYGETFKATVLSMTKAEGRTGPQIKVELVEVGTNKTFTTVYKIPKALTGKGQLDLLLSQLNKLGLHLKEMQGKTFEWKKMSLKELDPKTTMTGFDRHYPVKLLDQTKLKK